MRDLCPGLLFASSEGVGGFGRARREQRVSLGILLALTVRPGAGPAASAAKSKPPLDLTRGEPCERSRCAPRRGQPLQLIPADLCMEPRIIHLFVSRKTGKLYKWDEWYLAALFVCLCVSV